MFDQVVAEQEIRAVGKRVELLQRHRQSGAGVQKPLSGIRPNRPDCVNPPILHADFEVERQHTKI